MAPSIPCLEPREVWVDDGHVFVKTTDDKTHILTPEVAILLGRLLSDAGAESFVNKVMDEAAARQQA